ncbi:MAG: DUF1440 domain-containing protein [Acidobacteriaceae bacterium]|nr:DUF1440 domain-containing protein [Acidobacteriaceae bacterium]
MRTERTRNLWKGCLTGALGGFVGSFAMGQFHLLVHRAKLSTEHSGEDSTVKVASAIARHIFHHELTPRQKEAAGPIVHYAFGTSVAAVYGLAIELALVPCTGWGMPFSVAVWLGAHVIAVPALGLSEPVTESAPAAEATEFAAHLVYGAVAESLRSYTRKHLVR